MSRALLRLAPWLLIGVALALRVYRIADLTVFQGDQGIDALAARRLVVEHVWPVEGPATSAGGVHLGPLYYYLLALPMLFGGFDPLFDALLMAVLGAAAVGLLYWLARAWFGVVPAVSGAGLYALSPAAIVASRSAWNPAPAPFFLLLALLGLAQCHRSGHGRWLLLTGLGLGCVIQFHYFTLAVVVVGFVFTACEVVRCRSVLPWAVASAAVFALLLAPLLVHEVRDGFPNMQAARALAGASPLPGESVPRRLYEVLALGLVGTFAAARIEALAVVLTIALASGLLWRGGFVAALIGALLAAIAVEALLYRGPLFEHYFVPLAPLAFLALAAALAWLPSRFGLAAAAPLLALELTLTPVRDAPLLHVARTDGVARAIAAEAEGERFALWLMSPNDSDGAYRYQLARLALAPVTAEAALPPQLFILCEAAACDAMQLQQAAGPDWAAAVLTRQTDVVGVRVLRLEQRGTPAAAPARPGTA